MKGQAPIDPNAKFDPLPPTGVDSKAWVPGQEVSSNKKVPTEVWISGVLQPQAVEPVTETFEQWTDPATSTEWTDSADNSGMNWAPTDDGSASGDTWSAPDGSAQTG